ncbi:hypothetical protein [Streptomyces sp. NPDC007264]|uniref:hypothetical protein n=1 Tax=Streptomyces sp. NPDC007264 TaxID=3364777 RepID=UPI0036D96EC0
MSGVGPVEPVESAEPEPGHDVIGSDPPRLSDRWTRLPARTRAAVLGAAALAVTGALLFLSAPPVTPPPRPDLPPELPPWPVNVTRFSYAGVARRATAASPTGTFRFDISVRGGSPVTVSDIRAGLTGLRARATPGPSVSVPAGTTRRIGLEIAVADCAGLSLDPDLPFLDVTLRNTRAMQQHSFIFGGAFSRDLSELLHTVCGASGRRARPWPTGSARSQTADHRKIPPGRLGTALPDTHQPARHNKKVTSQRSAMPILSDRA